MSSPKVSQTAGSFLMMSVSLDGFFEAADRDISWHLVDDELLRH
ncbi:hypothetical protein [Pseudarthrobacter sp. NBSH8]|nr:hypothetical protein [Pseudarthrobacter sp. NBSH8]